MQSVLSISDVRDKNECTNLQLPNVSHKHVGKTSRQNRSESFFGDTETIILTFALGVLKLQRNSNIFACSAINTGVKT